MIVHKYFSFSYMISDLFPFVCYDIIRKEHIIVSTFSLFM